MRLLVCAASAVLLVLAAGAAADDVVVPLHVRPGVLSLAPAVTAALGRQVSLTVVDARGSGRGWSVLARTTGPSARVVVVAVESRCGPHSTCTMPRSTLRYPVALDRLRSTTVLAAIRGTGMGTIVLTLKLAASALPGTRLGFTVRAG